MQAKKFRQKTTLKVTCILSFVGIAATAGLNLPNAFADFSYPRTATTPPLPTPPPPHILTQADCAVCHGAASNIDRHHNLINKPPLFLGCINLAPGNFSTGCHTPDTAQPSGFKVDRDCSICHGNTAISHYNKHSFYIASWATQTGVMPGTAPLWTQITAFTPVNPAQKQYQECYKCHSYNAFGAQPNGVSPVVSRSNVNLTDQAMEFNPNNRSAHPVQVGLNSQTGSYAPKPLSVNQMTYPWTLNPGTQTMNCSDCHEAPLTPGSVGPQGSATKFLLKGPGVYWPYDRSGNLWKLGSSLSTDLFCKNCHPITGGSGEGGYRNNVHGEGDHRGTTCIGCHVTVSHGYRISRLIAYDTDPAPYTTLQDNGRNAQLLKGFRKASSPNNYGEGNCYSTVGACDEHNGFRGPYDPSATSSSTSSH